ncbi:MAG: Holliday junction resolvase RuvX [Candidatus Peribacteraceae bacterium]|nr:Holliday junction resolvase RuvX [Candidatus Peribacteraceae bacterium]MDD5742972.1 Holliday junction resolvase RuvX [Candidatus Peribacteraceae bacterium]
MARILALDIGTKRTGVAYLDEETNVPLPLFTLHHESVASLLSQVSALLQERQIDRLIVGLPLLPSGDEGAQARFVRSVTEQMRSRGWAVTLKDERYTTPRGKTADPDAIAAFNLL